MGKKKGDTKGADGGSDAKAPKPATHVNVRHILCEKHSKIMEAQGRIQAGEQFSQVASQMSEDKARQGGALGWKTRQEVVGAFADAAFKLGVGEMTQAPVKTQFGYHLILCEGRK
jgi:NIMA-interacting peptidyl-prolyl cis-trans isomerase 4